VRVRVRCPLSLTVTYSLYAPWPLGRLTKPTWVRVRVRARARARARVGVGVGVGVGLRVRAKG
jgi:hypothetical protein